LKKIYILIIVLCTFNNANAQLESNIWYFGYNAGITFSTNPPSAITNGALSTDEGCATICNSNGDLQFYTDGVTVWNKNHQVMDNGTGLNGSFTSTQSAIIVPKPSSSNFFFIFTTDYIDYGSINLNNKGLQYSEVDISMNGGLGKVITKNIALIQPTSEKVTVAKHSNNNAYWVITHGINNNNFYAFLVSSNGINTTPVISSIGSFQLLDETGLGYLKVANNNKKLASAKSWGGELELFDFDNTNGIITNAMQIGLNESIYGVEFSPDNNKLYTSQIYLNVGSGLINNSIFQYDLLASNISNSKNIIYNKNNSYDVNSLQLGLDKKIYFSMLSNDSLGVINNPNDLNCNLIKNAIYLGGKKCFAGLPNFIPSLIIGCKPDASFTISDTNFCIGENFTFINTTTTPFTSQKWLLNGQEFASSKNANFTFNNLGSYVISLIAINDTCRDTVNTVINFISEGCEVILEIPNFFSPNNDGVNDIFIPSKIKGILSMNTSIYNRWGTLVFNSDELLINWDGKTNKGDKVADGVYYWIINYTDRNSNKLSKNGSVTVLK